MRPDPTYSAEENLAQFIGVIVMCAFIFGMYWNFDIKPHKNLANKETKRILGDAHERAVSAVDTINFDNTPIIDANAARKDSVRATKEMRRVIDDIYNITDYNDYVRDSVPLKVKTYKEPVYRINYTTNDTICDTITRYESFYGVSKHFSEKKAMSYSKFADAYNKYYKAIQKLEMARRQCKIEINK